MDLGSVLEWLAVSMPMTGGREGRKETPVTSVWPVLFWMESYPTES